jgi:hypothetical protein
MRDQAVVDVVIVGEAVHGDDSRNLAGVVGDVKRPSRVGHGDAVHRPSRWPRGLRNFWVVGVVVIGYSVRLVSAVGNGSPGVTQHPDAWDSRAGQRLPPWVQAAGRTGTVAMST